MERAFSCAGCAFGSELADGIVWLPLSDGILTSTPSEPYPSGHLQSAERKLHQEGTAITQVNRDLTTLTAFYRQIGCVKGWKPNEFAGSWTYLGFLVMGSSGKWYVVLDSPVDKHAAFIFRSDPENSWEDSASTSRRTIARSRPANFVTRVVHKEGWDRKMIEVFSRL